MSMSYQVCDVLKIRKGLNNHKRRESGLLSFTVIDVQQNPITTYKGNRTKILSEKQKDSALT